MKNFVQNGSNLTVTLSSAVSSGDIVVVGDLVGVAVTDIAASGSGAIATDGVFEFDRASGSTLAVGDVGYVNSSGKITDTTTNNDAVGLVVAVSSSKVELKIFGRKVA